MKKCMICGTDFMDGNYCKPSDALKCLSCRAKEARIILPDPIKAAEAAKRSAERKAYLKEQARRQDEQRKLRTDEADERLRLEKVREQELKKKQLILLFSGLKDIIPNYTHRDSQIEIARAVESAIESRKILMVEAGVGTGKTFAYLIPSIFEKCNYDNEYAPIIISTKTINLQEQLERDIKNIRELFIHLGMRANIFSLQNDSDIIISKGKRNYCCRKNLQDIMAKSGDSQSEKLLSDVERWLDAGGNEFSESMAPRLKESLREDLQVDRCAQDCPFHSTCSFSRLKNNRKNAVGIIVTNHNQLVNDLKLRRQDVGSLWKKPCAIIIDEAHALEEVARNELAIKVSIHKIHRILNKASANASVRKHGDNLRPSLETLKSLNASVSGLIEQPSDTGSLITRYPIKFDESLKSSIRDILKAVEMVDDKINIIIISLDDSRTKEISALENISRDLEDVENSLEEYVASIDDAESQALWVEKNRHGAITLMAAPLSPGQFLRETLWDASFPIIMTSGTMTTNKSFKQIEDALNLSGVSKRRRETPIHFDSPYDYENNVLIYVPKDIPDPRPIEDGEEDAFTPAIARRIHELLTYSRGRALVLFTTHYRLGVVYEHLLKSNLGYAILKQGDASPGIVLERFREDYSSVLLATRSLWEGTDVVGDALSLLVIDKLPFPVPSDPLIKKLMERAERQGKDPMQEIQLPMMLTDLSQGSGRLIRQEGDSGIIALLDRRAWREKYNSLVVNHLPPGRWTSDISDVQKWFA